MTTEQTKEIVHAYHKAWTGPDVASAGKYIADTFITRAPVGSYDSKETYITGLTNFRTNFVIKVDLIAEFFDEGKAMLLYDVHTNTPAGVLRTAEYFTLVDEKIASTMLIFDATLWKAMLAKKGKTVDEEGHVIPLEEKE